MKISKIEFQDRDNHFKITLDNDKILYASYDLYNELSLQVNKDLSNFEMEILLKYETEKILFSKINNFISYRIRSEKEIRNRLLKENVNEEQLENVISKYKEQKIIDDHYFAKVFFENKAKYNNWSIRKIEYELNLKGISREIINSLKFNYMDLEYENARNIIDKKIYSWNNKYDKYKLKNKIYSFLSQKGFSYDVINTIVEEYAK